nr:hypothetical protein CFP56_02665 [Quercus suber]
MTVLRMYEEEQVCCWEDVVVVGVDVVLLKLQRVSIVTSHKIRCIRNDYQASVSLVLLSNVPSVEPLMVRQCLEFFKNGRYPQASTSCYAPDAPRSRLIVRSSLAHGRGEAVRNLPPSALGWTSSA